MTEEAHLTTGQLDQYQAGTLEAGELLTVDRHLAECDTCRDALYLQIGADHQARELRSQFSSHLNYQQVVAFVDGSPCEPEADAHLRECAACQTEVEDLHEFRQRLAVNVLPLAKEPKRRAGWVIPAWVGAAAAVLVLAGIAVRRGERPSPLPVPESPLAQQASKPREAPLTAEQQAVVDVALVNRQLERAAVLGRLITHRGVLLGEPTETKTFELNAPVGTAVMTDQPTFRWQAVPGASKYVVSVFNEKFSRVVESPVLAGATEWRPTEPLARGKIYIWQVSATVGGETVHAPIPPAPEARFQVAAAEAAAVLDQARQQHPSNHLMLAAMLARDGALDEAAIELDALDKTDPDTARSLRQSLAEIRRR